MVKRLHLLYYEELNPYLKISKLKQIRFDDLLRKILNVFRRFKNVGMTSIDPISIKGNLIQPIEFLQYYPIHRP